MAAKKACVLLIEAESDLQALNKLILSEFGYRVATTPPTNDPIEVAATVKPDVIVLHIRPGQPDDWKILDRLQADARTEGIPVVVISASERVLVEAHAAPTVRHTVVMPYDIEALQKAVEQALGPPPVAVLPPARHPPPTALAYAAKLLQRNLRMLTLRALQALIRIEPFRARFAQLSPEFIDEVPAIVDTIAIGLLRDLSPGEIVTPTAIQQTIREHVNLRMSQGLSLPLVIREYEILSEQIRAFLQEHVGANNFSALDAFDIASRIDTYFAEVIRTAVADFLSRLREICAELPPTPKAAGK